MFYINWLFGLFFHLLYTMLGCFPSANFPSTYIYLMGIVIDIMCESYTKFSYKISILQLKCICTKSEMPFTYPITNK